MTLKGSPSATSSPESGDGPSQHEWPDGTTIDLFGAPPAPVSHSRRLALGSEPMIRGICGRTYIGSSTPPGPLSSWENRLRERLAMVGSTECALIWKPARTPAGRLISRLAPSTLHSNGTGYAGSLWVAPSARDWKDSAGLATETEDGRTRIDQLPRQMIATALGGAEPNGSPATTESSAGYPPPAHPCWLMGFPETWLLGAASATRSSRRSRGRS